MTKENNTAIEARNLNIFYDDFLAVKDVNLKIQPQKITAIIGPSGCGKSTMLRAFNRMNDLIPSANTKGEVLYNGQNILTPDVDPVEVRRRIGMVFQKPNPFPRSIYENVAWGARINGYRGNLDTLVEESLRGLHCGMKSTISLTAAGFHCPVVSSSDCASHVQSRLKPDIILMDEPASALDPLATLKIEELMRELSKNYTIIVVTHNMQQAARVSDFTAFFNLGEARVAC